MDNGYTRRIIRITAEDSPNVQYARAEQAAGREPSNKMVLPGVLSWADYQKRRKIWDKIRQSIGLDAQFWDGAEVLLFPPEWLNDAERVWNETRPVKNRTADGVGIDPAEGGDNTSFCAVDRLGIMALESYKTPDTTKIIGYTVEFCKRHGVDPKNVYIDRGGGGKQLADHLRQVKGFGGVRTVSFGAPVSVELKRGMSMFVERRDVVEERGAAVNLRSQMYGAASDLLDPLNVQRFGIIPASRSDAAANLRQQLAVIPKWYDREGKLMLPPKNRKPGEKTGTVKTLVELIGHSPDEADAFVLAVHAMLARDRRPKAGRV